MVGAGRLTQSEVKGEAEALEACIRLFYLLGHQLEDLGHHMSRQPHFQITRKGLRVFFSWELKQKVPRQQLIYMKKKQLLRWTTAL